MFSLRLLLVIVFAPLVCSCQLLEAKSDLRNDITDLRADIKAIRAYITYERDENACVLGVPQTVDCYYVVTITNPDPKKDKMGWELYEGQFSKKACEQNRDSGNQGQNCETNGLHFAKRYFPIKGSPKGLKKVDYEFIGQVDPDSPTAELVCLKADGTPDTTGNDCAVRDKPLKVIRP